jgi:D-alanine-D-alanine ligase
MQNFRTSFIEKSAITYPAASGKKHVAIIMGGMSAEREVSIMSSKGVTDSFVRQGYRVTIIDMGADIADALMRVKPDVVFNCLHGTYGEDGCLPGLLNILRIPYTHSGVLASALAFNKIKSKDAFVASGILTAGHVLVSKSDNIKTDPMPRPYVIKPLSQGSSIGIELVFPEDDFDFGDYAFPYGETVIIEEYVKGREMQVAVLNGKAIGILEIKLLKNKRFYDYETKYTEGFAEHLLPAPVPKEIYQLLLDAAEKANEAVGATGLCRVEFIYEESSGKVYILEVNTHPGMTPLSICPEIVGHKGISFDNLMEEILSSARFEE